MTTVNYHLLDEVHSMPSTVFNTGGVVWGFDTPKPPTHAGQNTELRNLALDNIAKEFDNLAKESEAIRDRASHAASQARKLRNLPQVRDEPRKSKKR
jgi:hypothetical protein